MRRLDPRPMLAAALLALLAGCAQQREPQSQPAAAVAAPASAAIEDGDAPRGPDRPPAAASTDPASSPAGDVDPSAAPAAPTDPASSPAGAVDPSAAPTDPASSPAGAVDPAAAPAAPPPWIDAVGQAHRLADAAGRGDASTAVIDAAHAALAAAFDRPAEPRGHQVVRQDLAGRLARLQRRRGQPARALQWTTRGLALDAPATLFTARLLHERAMAAEALSKPEIAAAARARLEAVQARLGAR